MRSEIMSAFRRWIGAIEETPVAARAASNDAEFARLGLTDVAIAQLDREQHRVLTVDFDLDLELAKRGYEVENPTAALFQ